MTTGEGIGVGMLGYAFMGKAHSRAFREAKALHAPLAPELVSLSGRTADKVEAARKELGWAEAVTDWREQVADERIGHHLLTAIAGDGTVGPHGATFEDGYRCAEVCDAIVRSAESGKREEITYRGVEG